MHHICDAEPLTVFASSYTSVACFPSFLSSFPSRISSKNGESRGHH